MEKFIFIKDKNFTQLPKTSGVYHFLDKKETIYIGKAIDIQKRVKNHFQQPSYRDNLFIDKVDKIGYLETGSEIEALILEANLIKKNQPKFNVIWKDDKNYFYVAVANGSIPFIYITHQPFDKAQGKKNEQTRYIGPFVEGTALKKTLKFLRRVFPYYTVKKHPNKNCTYCHLGLCPGPTPDLKEYKNNIKKLISVLEGKSSTVLNSLKKEMSVLSKQNKYEEAAVIRDRIYNLQQVMAHTHVLEPNNFVKPDLTKSLRELLQLEKITRIECYDISNTQGKQATGSMVVFIDGKPDKSQYKKFKIKMENEPNDIAMIEEVINRRLAHKEWNYPEIMLIDGGIAQLNIAIKVKNKNPETKSIKVISIAKHDKDLYIEGRAGFIPLKSLPREIYNLVLQLDDEAHRFAIAYHRKLRKNNLLKE